MELDSNSDKEAAMASAPPRSHMEDGITAVENYGPKELVTGVCETIGLKLDPFGNGTVDSSDDGPALKGSLALLAMCLWVFI